jgi:hypothetical protein
MTTSTRITFWILDILFPILLQAQNTSLSPDNNIASVDNIQLFQISGFNNSVFPFTKNQFFGLRFQNHFLIKELTLKHLWGCLEWDNHYFPISISHFGYSQFGLFECKIGYTRSFNSKISFNFNFIYLYNHISEYKNRNGCTFEVSFWGKINSKIGCGFTIFNPALLDYIESKESLIPVKIYFSGWYKINEYFLIFANLEKNAPGNFDFLLTFLMQKNKRALETQFSFKSLGVSYIFQFKSLVLKCNGNFHFQLGTSSELDLFYVLKP